MSEWPEIITKYNCVIVVLENYKRFAHVQHSHSARHELYYRLNDLNVEQRVEVFHHFIQVPKTTNS